MFNPGRFHCSCWDKCIVLCMDEIYNTHDWLYMPKNNHMNKSFHEGKQNFNDDIDHKGEMKSKK